MGFGTFFTALAGDMVSNAVLFLGEIEPVFAVLFGVAVVGFLVSLVARFVRT